MSSSRQKAKLVCDNGGPPLLRKRSLGDPPVSLKGGLELRSIWPPVIINHKLWQHLSVSKNNYAIFESYFYDTYLYYF